MNVQATCFCGHCFEGALIVGRVVTPHVVCPECGKDCVVSGYSDVPMGVMKQGEGVQHRGQSLPVSKSLPDDNRAGTPDRLWGHPVRRHADGTYSTVDRRPIVRNNDDMRKHCERTGSVWEQ